MSIEDAGFKNTEEEGRENDLAKQQATTFDIEKFYKKPENQEELIENIRILKELPEDASDPKVIIKLGDPNESHKFVYMEDEDGRKYVIALPIDKKCMHAEIANLSRRLYKKDIHAIGGGYIHTEGDKLIIDGTSGSYGEAPKNAVKEILQKKFPGLQIEAFSLADYDAEGRENEYKKILESFESTFQKELYADVLDHRAVKAGFDYTSRPKNVEGNKDLAYMVYSSENGSSFGFDTLYIGYKNPRGEIKSKDIARERWYINIQEIKVENGNILINYIADNKKYTLNIKLDEIENFEMTSNLNDIEEQLVKMYKKNQSVYKNANVFHGLRQ